MSSPDRMPWGFVVALSTAQLVSYGTIFYAFALFIEPMGQDLGWSKSELTAAYSSALISSAFFAIPVGRLIDLGHGRTIMTAGSILAALLLALWSQVESYPLFVLIWIGMGAAMSAVFYDPGFAVLARRLGFFARRGLTAMTLIGGFASTVFIPLTHLLIEMFGWRGTLLVLAAFNLGICAVVHAIWIPPHQKPAPHAASVHSGTSPAPHPRHLLRRASFWLFVATSVAQGMISTGLPLHFIPILTEKGFTLEASVAAFSIIGPAQVAARLAMAFGEEVLSLRALGVLTMVLSVLAFALLPFIPPGSWLVAIFAGVFGASNGMMTIVKALLPPELFGRDNYGAIQGMIATPVRLAMATAPFTFGALWTWWGGYGAVLVACFVMALCSLIAFVLNLALARKT
ncbi:MFS transporter [Microvirga terricola]|uniref:MFS transporter n=1 Tax=Microvirga terricola TaxID=2719797 RepID=A0ABX0VAF7_9HYPH|nr:MFS transporter [Microvirga terricola]NIX76832.1 MFS transporter [Microvirga terricola]